jgi:RNA polymerase sigma-70 factor (ECF subfamily)
VSENLALACFPATLRKGPNIAGLNPETGELTPLFNPRADGWPVHFLRDGVWLRGRTPIGRTTAAVLDINHVDSLAVREAVRDEGLTTKMTHEITALLQAWSEGDSEALAKLIPLVDVELKKIARAYIRKERPGHILQTTALMDEAFIKLMETEKISWNDRKHFYSLAAKRMRQVLIDYARKRKAGKRGSDPDQVDITDSVLPALEAPEQLIMLHDALTKLASFDERKASVVELRYFGGFTLEEVAEILGVSQATVEREWRLARAWLKREIYGGDALESSEV